MKYSSSPQTYGLIGYPVKHSFSKAMHNAAFERLGINARYELFEVKPEELEDFLLNRKDVIGFNITIPHKVKAREILEKESPISKDTKEIQINLWYVITSGAVNTVKRNGDRLAYWNTDADGFEKSLEQDLKFELKDKNVFLFGCGGAGRAIIAGLSWQQHRVDKIYVFDKSKKAIDSARGYFKTLPGIWSSMLAEKIDFLDEDQIADKIKECQLLVNASPLGMKEGDGSPVEKSLLHKDLSVYDVVYNRQTQLIKYAKAAGLNAAGGLKMLLYQGVIAFEIWTGQKAPEDVMRKALEEELNKCRKS